MPRVPDILPGVGASPSRVGGFSAPEVVQGRDFTGQQLMQLGRAAEQAGQEWGRLGEQQQAEMDEAKVFEAVNATEEGDIKEESSFRSLAGKAAGDGFEPFMKSAQERRRKVLEGAENERQRLLMERALTRTMTDLSRRGMTHRDAQVKEFKAAELQTGISMSGQQFAMLAATGDEKGAALHYNTMIGRAVQLADARQLPADSELRKALVLGATTDAHASAVKMMLDGKRPQEAEAYLKQHGSEITPEVRAELAATARAGSIELMARNAFDAADTFTERKRFIDEAEDMTPKEQESATRHLVQMQDQESRENARIGVDVEREVDEWNAANPNLDLASENPSLFARASRYSVNTARTRVTDNRWFQQVYADNDAGKLLREQLRGLNPAQLHMALSKVTNSHDESQLTAFLRGDQSLASIKERTTMLARSLGYLPEGADKATPDQTRAFTAWVANTIDPIVSAQRDKLGRDLNVEEFQKLVVDPVKNDKAMLRATDLGVDWTDKDWGPFPMETMRLKGYAPIDNPDTQEDESLNFDKYKDLYVDVEGQQVFLYEIPMEERKNIRDAWSLNPANRGRFMSAADEAREWVKAGRRGDRKLETTKEAPSYQGVMDPAEFPVQVGASRLDHIWSDGKSIRQGSTAYPGYQPPKK